MTGITITRMLMPSVDEERARLEGAGLNQLAEGVRVEWRGYGILLRAVFFVLTVVAMVAFHAWVGNGLVTGIVYIALAELLILRARWWGTGVEEALCIGGVYALISELPRSGAPEVMLTMAAGAAVAGVRVRNPLFGALAAGLFVHYLERRFDLGVAAALAIAAVAVLALLRTWRRPSTEWLWIVIAVTMPVVGRFEADVRWRDMTILLYAAFAAFALVLALRKRHHAFFAAGGVALAIAAVDLAERVALGATGDY